MEIYGYVVEVSHINKETGKILYWDRYNKKIYKTAEIAEKAIEENPYFKKDYDGFMDGYKIITLYYEV